MKQLKKLVLHKTTPLTVPQMKHITGGYEGDDFTDKCIKNHIDGIVGGTCCVKTKEFRICAQCHLSMACAKALAERFGTNWCCDSCYDTGWAQTEC